MSGRSHVNVREPLLTVERRRCSGAVWTAAAAMVLGSMAAYASCAWPGPQRTVRLRLFWIRHGLSCANVLNACTATSGTDAMDAGLLPELEAALPKYVLPDASDATLDATFGIHSRPPGGKDCKVKVRLANGTSFETKLHHLLLDPLITDCSMKQSENAGRAFLRWLAERNIRLHFIASSTLLRAIQTAHHMFVEPCQNGGETCDVLVGNLTVSPLPYVAERSASKQPLQADNLPAPLSMQKDLLRSLYSHDIMDDRFVRHWPRLAQQYQEFKAFLALVLVPSLLSPPLRPTPGAREALEDAESSDFRVLQLPGGAYRVGPHFERATYDATEAADESFSL
ncbi:unnamed protein product [Symbiodinium sp. CCMP2456]|nr:unnamed protein product [Symbiodinium sp. CCMP2456]